jgi:hypothetical protein
MLVVSVFAKHGSGIWNADIAKKLCRCDGALFEILSFVGLSVNPQSELPCYFFHQLKVAIGTSFTPQIPDRAFDEQHRLRQKRINTHAVEYGYSLLNLGCNDMRIVKPVLTGGYIQACVGRKMMFFANGSFIREFRRISEREIITDSDATQYLSGFSDAYQGTVRIQAHNLTPETHMLQGIPTFFPDARQLHETNFPSGRIKFAQYPRRTAISSGNGLVAKGRSQQ